MGHTRWQSGHVGLTSLGGAIPQTRVILEAVTAHPWNLAAQQGWLVRKSWWLRETPVARGIGVKGTF